MNKEEAESNDISLLTHYLHVFRSCALSLVVSFLLRVLSCTGQLLARHVLIILHDMKEQRRQMRKLHHMHAKLQEYLVRNFTSTDRYCIPLNPSCASSSAF